MGTELGSQVATSLAVLALATVAAYLVVRLARRARGGALRQGGAELELLARLPLDLRRSVYLVRVGERVLVLGAGEAGLSKLAELPSEEILRAGRAAPPRPTWRTLLGRLGRTETPACARDVDDEARDASPEALS